MKKRYILLGLFLAFIIFVDWRIYEHHDLNFISSSDEPVVELFNDHAWNIHRSRSFLMRKITEQSPYSLLVHIILDDPQKLLSVSARNEEGVLVDLSYAQFAALSDDVIFGDMTRKYTLEYSNYDYHPEGYYTLHFERVHFTANDPLYLTVKYLDDDGVEIVEEVNTKIKTRTEWGSGFLSLMRYG